MVRIIPAGLVAAGAVFAVAAAQQPAGAPAPGALEAEEPESELDALSRSSDDQFPTAEEKANRRPVSVTLRALDKITARYTDLETPIEEPVKFGSLEILPHYCDKRPPEEFPETTAFLEIFDRDLARAHAAAETETVAGEAEGEGISETMPDVPAETIAEAPIETISEIPGETSAEGGEREFSLDGIVDDIEAKPVDPDRIFSGWMFASSPALNPLEHAVYDVWVIDCKTEVVDSSSDEAL